MSNRNSNPKKKKKNLKRRPPPRVPAIPRNLPVVNRQPTHLVYPIQVRMNNVGATYTNRGYSATSSYDVDLAFANTSMPYFAEMSAIYRKYVVRRAKITVGFACNEGFPVTVYLAVTNVAPTNNMSTYNSFIGNMKTRSAVIGGANAMNIKQLSLSTSIREFGGVDSRYVDNEYSSFVTTSPANNIYFVVGSITDQTNVFVTGLSYFVRVEHWTDFFEFATPTS